MRTVHGITRREVRLRGLPAPDSLELALPQGRICLVAGDSIPLTSALTEALTARSWRVALWQSVPNEVQMQQQLADITETHGPVAAFIHLNPPNTDGYFSARDEALLKQTFLMAKHLKVPLTEAAQQGYAAFMTVARLDGALALTGGGSSIAGGLFGLTKTLALEWHTAQPRGVFCRAVDIAPDFEINQTVQAILAELHDPNRRLVEVGWSKRGRVTLINP